MTETVTIGGREFRVGVWYELRRRAHGLQPVPRQFLGWNADQTNVVAMTDLKSRRYFHPLAWAEVAGEEVPAP